MKSTIYLARTAQGWVARAYGPYGEEIRRLFGANELPTGFTVNASSSFVLTEIARLNPDCEVKLAA